VVEGLKLEADWRRDQKREEREVETQKREKKTQKSIPAKIYIPAETHRNPPKWPKHSEILPEVECGGVSYRFAYR
jgi:hypothetical protein